MRPEVDFRLEVTGKSRTRVFLDFRVTPPLPAGVRQLAEWAMRGRIQRLHVEYLRLLKQRVERRAAGS